MDSAPRKTLISPGYHAGYMTLALQKARLSTPKPTNFRVGAVLLDADSNTILATGYTGELPGNTHAEQCCFMKVAKQHNLPEDEIGEVLPRNTVLYTTMEPCDERLSGNRTCVDRILGLGGAIKVVYAGVLEPEAFIGQNRGRWKLEDAGVEVRIVEGMREQILDVATEGHERIQQ
ncbi:hypothetical protein V494_06299 [Pseudogymnoascus sp. VKM F-4513 (FW-928)]|nr:hypothetical protein V494_06299 [Pseudogymnoascus sp. VKM F-4513 (FW-928)]